MNDDVPGLRERRRLDTHQEIHLAALDLIETQGLKETTVQQIADRAGVSPRTFFRYFSSKEQACLPGQRRMLHMIDTLELSGRDLPALLREVESAAESVIGSEKDPELVEHRRIARLLIKEPELQAVAASQERILASHLRARLEEQSGGRDPLALMLMAEIVVAVWRTSWERWGELAVEGKVEDPAEFYRHCREELRRLIG